jgi:small neutral amino acid transporter SnatA (MarC family)
MHLSARGTQVRNLSVAVANGSITLIILLIAPLGLAAVIINTLLVTLSTYLTATAADWVVRYLKPKQVRADMMGGSSSGAKMRRHQSSESDLSQYD